MKKIRSTATPRIMFAIFVFALLLAYAEPSNAQKRKPFPSPSIEPTASDSTSTSIDLRTREQAALEMGILMSRRTLSTDLERQRRRAAAKLADDLEQLEQIHTTKIVPLSSAATLDYKRLAQASAELKHRATRIKFYSPIVLIDRTGERIRYEADASQLATMLPQLSRVVAKFVANPVFRISAPNDAELRSVAAHDLDNIIKLSDTINKIAKRLSKSLVASK
jgi:hypothetical protein